MSPATLLKDARVWIATAILVLTSLILVWWFWYSIELLWALSQVRVEQGSVSVDGVEISNSYLVTRDRETHGRWEFRSQDLKDPTYVTAAYCGWNTYDDDHQTLIPFDIPPLYHQAVTSVTRKVGRQPELYRWEDDESYPWLSAVWQVERQTIEMLVGHSNDSDVIKIRIIPGRIDWEADRKRTRLVRLNRRPVNDQDVADFLATFRGR